MRVITYEEVLKNEDKYILVDVRTSKEYSYSTIPGAINIMLLNNEQHKIVGTLYKEEGRRVATKKALELFGPNLVNIYEEFENVSFKGKEIIIFCARGGMRSTTLVNFLHSLAIPVIKLDHGYKGYRKYVLDNLEEMFTSKNYITLYGNTGVGKTVILHKLKEQGVDILDLEQCARHRGSLLGDIGLEAQYSQKMFESLVFDQLRNSGDTIFVEGESKRIGSILLHNYMYEAIHSCRKVILQTTIENRIEIIKDDYLKTGFSKEEMITAVKRLGKYVTAKTVNQYVNLIENDNYDEVIRVLIEEYYDKKYKSSICEDDEIIFYNYVDEAVEKLKKLIET